MYKFVLALGILAHAVAGDYVATLLILGAGDQSIVGKVIASVSVQQLQNAHEHPADSANRIRPLRHTR
jgi:hypothetical protein